MKLVQACFVAERIPFFFRASALFHSDLASADRGDFLHVLNNFLAFFTRLAKFSFHHGLLGFCLVVPSGLTFLKFFRWLIPGLSVKISITSSGSSIEVKFAFARCSSIVLFQAGHYSSRL